MTKRPKNFPMPPEGALNLRLAYMDRCSPSEDPDCAEWQEARCHVWFDHKLMGWVATPAYEHKPTAYMAVKALGYDPMDAVDQLVDLLTRRDLGAYGTWDARRITEFDEYRGYGPTFAANPYAYSLESGYQATTLEIGFGWLAYIERKDGRVFVGFAEDPRAAVRTLEEDMLSDSSQHLTRVPGTGLTLPQPLAFAMGIYPEQNEYIKAPE